MTGVGFQDGVSQNHKEQRVFQNYISPEEAKQELFLNGEFPDSLNLEELNQSLNTSQINNAYASKAFTKNPGDIQQMKDDYQAFPQCAERSLVCLIYTIWFNFYRSDQKTDLTKHFSLLKHQLREEELLTDSIAIEISEAERLYSVGHQVDSAEKLECVLDLLRPLHLNYSFKLIEKQVEQGQVIKGKDIIALLSPSGWGKSTTFLHLAKQEMVRVIGNNGLPHIQSKNVTDPILKEVVSTNQYLSASRSIIPFLIDEEEKIYLVDTIGAGDTGGPALDLANGIGMIEAFKNANSIRVALLINGKDTGKRFEGVNKFIKIITGLFPNLESLIKNKSIICLFTDYLDLSQGKPSAEQYLEAQKLINTQFKAKKSDMTPKEKLDTGFTKFINFIVDSTSIDPSKKKEGALIVDPINGDSEKLLNQLLKLKPLKRLHNVFKFSISLETRLRIDQQVSLHLKAITNALNRNAFELLELKLNELLTLSRYLQDSHTTQNYDDSVSTITKHLSTCFQRACSQIDKGLASENELTPEEVKNYKQAFDKQRRLDSLRFAHFKDFSLSNDTYSTHIQRKIKDFENEILKVNQLNNPSLPKKMSKLRDLEKEFFSEDRSFKMMIDHLSTLLVNDLLEARGSIEEKDFAKFSDLLHYLEEANKNISQFLPYLQYSVPQLIETFHEKIKMLKAEANQLISLENFEYNDAESLNHIFHLLSVGDSLLLRHKLDQNFIKSTQEELQESLVLVFNQHSSIIETEKATLQDGFMERIRLSLVYQDKLIKISKLQDKVYKIFDDNLSKVIWLIKESKMHVDAVIQDITDGKKREKAQYDQLYTSLQALKDASWIEKFKEGTFKDDMKSVIEKIKSFTEDLESKASKNKLDSFASYQKLPSASKNITQLKYMMRFITFEPLLEKIILDCCSRFENQIKDALDQISSNFVLEKIKASSSKQIVYEEAENALLYLTTLEQINLEKVLSGRILSDFRKFLIDYQQMVKEEAIASFKTITNHTTCKSSKLMCEQYCILYNRLNELVNMQDSDSFPNVLKIMQPKSQILKEIKERQFMIYLDNISDDLNQKLSEQHFEDALNLINELRTLKDLDPLLEGQLNFKDLHKEFSNRIRQTDAPGLAREIKEALHEGDYSSVFDKMPKLKASQLQTKYEELIRDINKHVKDLSDSTQQQMKNFYMCFDGGSRFEVLLIQIDALMKKFQNAKDELLPLLDENRKLLILKGEEQQKEIVLEEIKKLLDKYIDYIKQSKFSESEKLRRTIELIHSSEQRKFINQNTKVLQQIKGFDKLEADCLTKKEKEILKSEFKDLKDLRLIEYISSLDQVTNEKYIQARNTAIKQIKVKFLDELKKVGKAKPADLPAKRRLLKNIKHQVRSCCPDSIKADIEINIRDEEELITRNEEKRKLEFQSACDTKSYSELQKFHEEFTLQENTENIFLIHNFISKETQNYYESLKAEDNSTVFITELMHTNNFLKATIVFKAQRMDSESKIKQLVQSRFSPGLQKLQQSYQEIQEPQRLSRLRFLSMSSLRDSSSDSEYHSASSEDAQDQIKYLKEFIILEKLCAENLFVMDDYLPNYSKLSKKISQSIVTFFTNLSENFKKALDSEKIDELNHALSTMKSRDKELKILKEINSSESLHKIGESLKGCLSYPDMQYKLEQYISTFQEEIAAIDLSKMINQFEAIRQQYYRKIKAKFQQSVKLESLKRHLSQSIVDVKKLRNTFENKILEQLDILQREALKYLNDQKQDKDSLSKFSEYYKGLKEVLRIMELEDKIHQKKLDNLTNTILQRVALLKQNAESDLGIENLSTCLIQMKMIAEHISELSSTIDAQILEILNLFKSKKGTSNQIKQLGCSLDGSHTGNLIIEQFSIFKIYLKGEWKKKTEGHNITYVLDKIQGDGICKESLKCTFDEFTKVYEDLVTKALQQANNIQGVYETLIVKIRLLSGSIPKHHETLTNDQYSVIPELLANICTLFTLVTSEEYFDEKGSDMQDYVTTLHTGQVIGIFRLLGIGDEREDLQSNLVQVGTGEGKSYIIGLLAILMALLGFDVSCACYSKYLSERDKLSFSKLITLLSLNQYIQYGTFNEICESLISKKGNVRGLTLKVLNKDDNPKQETVASKRLSVLIIDEYDTLLNNSLYLNMFNPSIQLTDPSIKALLDLIWGKRNEEYSFKSIKSSPQFQQCLKNYVGLETLFEEILKQILSDLKDFESQPSYKILEDQIYYKDQDGLSNKISYGYKTLFALYKENEAKQISDACLEKNQCFVIKCGSYSYAEIPKKFNFILGVTGTLESLRVQEKEINRIEYKISKSTVLPSVFGKNNLDFIPSRDIRVEASEDYENALVREITDRRESRGKQNLRPVIVFFRNKSELEKFYHSPKFAQYKEKTKFLTEDAKAEEKNQLVKEATQSGQILLATLDFGRGTDFKIRDPLVLRNDGAHVLIAFFPPDLSSQIQMIGRVARQGEKGSASMIINQDSLEEYNIPPQEVAEYKGKLDVLFNAKREASFQSEFQNNMKWLEGIKDEHQQSEEFLEVLSQSNASKASVLPYIIKFNKGAYNELSPCKTMILIDLTSSMNELLQKLKSVIGILCSRVDDILGKHNIEEGTVKIQIVFYRNYNSKEDDILIPSPWECKAENLMKFLNQYKVEGGWGREAVEIGLWHANQESQTADGISQIILIGDSPSNTPQEVNFKRKTEFTEEYWATTKFAEPTHESKELEKLIANGIKVHAFYLKDIAKECFINIAKSTGGRHEHLDLSNSQKNMAKSGDQLANFFCEEILNCVGETRLKGWGEKLRKEYQDKFAKSYV